MSTVGFNYNVSLLHGWSDIYNLLKKFCNFFGWARVCWPLLCLWRPFVFKVCLDSNQAQPPIPLVYKTYWERRNITKLGVTRERGGFDFQQRLLNKPIIKLGLYQVLGDPWHFVRHGSGSSDPYLCPTDPEGLKTYEPYGSGFGTLIYLHHSWKIKSHQEVPKQGFSYYFCLYLCWCPQCSSSCT